jgi:hypothetical protein
MKKKKLTRRRRRVSCVRRQNLSNRYASASTHWNCFKSRGMFRSSFIQYVRVNHQANQQPNVPSEGNEVM